VLYGTDAVSGVIQLFTRSTGGPPRWDASVRSGTYGTLDVAAGLHGGTAGARYGVSVAHHATDGIHSFNSDYRRGTLSGVVRVAPDARTDASVSLHYTDTDAHVPTDGAGRVVDRNAHELRESIGIGVDVGRRITGRAALRLLLAIHSQDGGFDDAADGPADTLGFFAFRSLDRIDRRSADARIDVDLTGSAIVTGGIAVEQQRQRSFNESSSEFGADNGAFEADRTNRAAYAQLIGTAGSLSWQVGARLDDNAAFGTFRTYRGGAAWSIAQDTRLRASLGTGFREPTFFENYSQGFARGNPALEPERTRSWEVGVERRAANGAVTLGATWFDQRFRDLIDFTFATPGPTDPNWFNVAHARSRGLEVEASARLHRTLSADAAWTWLDARVTTPGFDSTALGTFRAGESLLRRPEHTLSAGIAWSPAAAAFMDVRARRIGERADRDFENGARVTLPAHTILDASARMRLLQSSRSELSLGLRVANVLNESYEEVFAYRAPGRTLLLSLHAAF
jgi:vitamin B12 transporter